MDKALAAVELSRKMLSGEAGGTGGLKLQGGMLRGVCFLQTAARCWAVHTGQRLQQREVQPAGTRYGISPGVPGETMPGKTAWLGCHLAGGPALDRV